MVLRRIGLIGTAVVMALMANSVCASKQTDLLEQISKQLGPVKQQKAINDNLTVIDQDIKQVNGAGWLSYFAWQRDQMYPDNALSMIWENTGYGTMATLADVENQQNAAFCNTIDCTVPCLKSDAGETPSEIQQFYLLFHPDYAQAYTRSAAGCPVSIQSDSNSNNQSGSSSSNQFDFDKLISVAESYSAYGGQSVPSMSDAVQLAGYVLADVKSQYQTTDSLPDGSSQSAMLTLGDFVKKPFKGSSQADANQSSDTSDNSNSTGPGDHSTGQHSGSWMDGIMHASTPQLLRTIAVQLAVNNYLNYKQLQSQQTIASLLAAQVIMQGQKGNQPPVATDNSIRQLANDLKELQYISNRNSNVLHEIASKLANNGSVK